MNLKESNVLVTGASGLIGYNLAKKLVGNVGSLSAITHKTEKIIPSVVHLKADLLNFEDCLRATQDVDIVFHCAANSSGAASQAVSPTNMSRESVIINANFFEAAHQNKVKKIIWLASTTGYPEGDHAMKEDEMFLGNPFDKYFAIGWMKRYTEKLCELYSKKVSNPMTCVVLRPTNIYGPNDKVDPKRSHVLSALIRKVIERQNPIEVWGTGTDVRDVLYVDDMVDAMVLAAENVENFDQFNIGYGVSYSVLELLEIVKAVAHYDAPYKLIPTGPTMIPFRAVNIKKANDVLKWKPNVSVYSGIAKTYDWMKSELLERK